MTDSPYGLAALWAQGDNITKGVALLLVLMSIVSWYLILTRAWRTFRMRRSASSVAAFWQAHSGSNDVAFLNCQELQSPFRQVALQGKVALDHHCRNKHELQGQLSLAQWLTESLRGAIDDSTERMNAGLAVLASVGSTAPFVGLFGTVWGIYHALVGISASGQASIDKVAGPVGEALIMTAFGLAVAIPAVLAYNALVRSNKGVSHQLNRFARQLHAYLLTGSVVGHEPGKVLALRTAEG